MNCSLEIATVLSVAVICASSCSAAVLPMSQPTMAVRVEAGDYAIGSKTVTVLESTGLPIDAPERIAVHGEEVVISDDKPAMYTRGTLLRETLGPVDKFTRVPMAIVPDSVKINSCSVQALVYAKDKDYFLDTVWGGVSRIEGGSIPKGSKVSVDYVVHRQRIDAVELLADGRAVIKKGKSAAVCPEMPLPDDGATIIAYVFVQFRTTAIGRDDIYPLPSSGATWRDYIKTAGRQHIQRTLGLLESEKPVTIVCWGDSVTAGGSSSTRDKCYVELLRARLKAAYPKTEINVINAGIGGSNTESRRAGFDADVLAHKPDLITVEYINDVGMGPEKVAKNHAEYMARARASLPNVEFIVITPHFVRPDWMGPYEKSVDAMRKTAAENNASVADTANIWANLREVGIPYATLLANEINHPNDLGHEFFAETLMKLLKPSGD